MFSTRVSACWIVVAESPRGAVGSVIVVDRHDHRPFLDSTLLQCDGSWLADDLYPELTALVDSQAWPYGRRVGAFALPNIDLRGHVVEAAQAR